MGLSMPSFGDPVDSILAGLWNVVAVLTAGQKWPEADEDQFWPAEEHWQEIADAVNEAVNELGPAFTQILSSVTGEVGTALSEFYGEIGKADGLPGMAAFASQLGTMCYNFGLLIEYDKYSIIAALIVTAAVIAISLALAPLFGASLGAIPGALAGLRGFLVKLLLDLIKEIAGEVLEEVLIDVMTQSAQMLWGHRREWDGQKTWDAFRGGVVGGALGKALSPLTNFLNKPFNRLMPNGRSPLALPGPRGRNTVGPPGGMPPSTSRRPGGNNTGPNRTGGSTGPSNRRSSSNNSDSRRSDSSGSRRSDSSGSQRSNPSGNRRSDSSSTSSNNRSSSNSSTNTHNRSNNGSLPSRIIRQTVAHTGQAVVAGVNNAAISTATNGILAGIDNAGGISGLLQGNFGKFWDGFSSHMPGGADFSLEDAGYMAANGAFRSKTTEFASNFGFNHSAAVDLSVPDAPVLTETGMRRQMAALSLLERVGIGEHNLARVIGFEDRGAHWGLSDLREAMNSQNGGASGGGGSFGDQRTGDPNLASLLNEQERDNSFAPPASTQPPASGAPSSTSTQQTSTGQQGTGPQTQQSQSQQGQQSTQQNESRREESDAPSSTVSPETSVGDQSDGARTDSGVAGDTATQAPEARSHAPENTTDTTSSPTQSSSDTRAPDTTIPESSTTQTDTGTQSTSGGERQGAASGPTPQGTSTDTSTTNVSNTETNAPTPETRTSESHQTAPPGQTQSTTTEPTATTGSEATPSSRGTDTGQTQTTAPDGDRSVPESGVDRSADSDFTRRTTPTNSEQTVQLGPTTHTTSGQPTTSPQSATSGQQPTSQTGQSTSGQQQSGARSGPGADTGQRDVPADTAQRSSTSEPTTLNQDPNNQDLVGQENDFGVDNESRVDSNLDSDRRIEPEQQHRDDSGAHSPAVDQTQNRQVPATQELQEADRQRHLTDENGRPLSPEQEAEVRERLRQEGAAAVSANRAPAETTTAPESTSSEQNTDTSTDTDPAVLMSPMIGPETDIGPQHLEERGRGPSIHFGHNRRTGSDLTADVRQRVSEAQQTLRRLLPASPALDQRLAELDTIADLANRIDQLEADANQTGDLRPLMDGVRELSQAVREYADQYSNQEALDPDTSERVDISGWRDVDGIDPLDSIEMSIRVAPMHPFTGRFASIDLAIMIAKVEDILGSDFANHLLRNAHNILPLEPNAVRFALEDRYGPGPEADNAYEEVRSVVEAGTSRGVYGPSSGIIVIKPDTPQNPRSLASVAATLVHEATHALQIPDSQIQNAIRDRVREQLEQRGETVDKDAVRREAEPWRARVRLESEFQGFTMQRHFLNGLVTEGVRDANGDLLEVPADYQGRESEDTRAILNTIQQDYFSAPGTHAGYTQQELFGPIESLILNLDIDQTLRDVLDAVSPDHNPNHDRVLRGPITEWVADQLGIDLDSMGRTEPEPSTQSDPQVQEGPQEQSRGGNTHTDLDSGPRRGSELTEDIRNRVNEIRDALRRLGPSPELGQRLAELDRIEDLANQVDQRADEAARSGDLRPLVDSLRELSQATTTYTEQHASDTEVTGVPDLAGLDPLDSAEMANRVTDVDPETGRFRPVDLATMIAKIEDVLGPEFANRVLDNASRTVPLDSEATRRVLEEKYGPDADQAYNSIKTLINDPEVRANQSSRLDLIMVRPGLSLSETASLLVHENTHRLQPSLPDILQAVRAQVGSDWDAVAPILRIKLEREFQAFAMQRHFLQNLETIPPGREAFVGSNNNDILEHIRTHYFATDEQRRGFSWSEITEQGGFSRVIDQLDLDTVPDQVMQDVLPERTATLTGPVTQSVLTELGIDPDSIPAAPSSTDNALTDNASEQSRDSKPDLSRLTPQQEELRNSLSPQAQDLFDRKFASAKSDPNRLEYALNGLSRKADKEGKTLEQVLEELAENEARQEAKKQDAAASLPPEVRTRIDSALKQIENLQQRINAIEQTYPNVNPKITREWRVELERQKNGLENAKEEGRRDVEGYINDINGIHAEISFVENTSNVSGIGKPITVTLPDGTVINSQVDVLSNNDRTWNEIKNYRPFGLYVRNPDGSIDSVVSQAEDIIDQARRQILIAAFNPDYHVNGQPPEIRITFPRGVTLEVARLLENLPDQLPELQQGDPRTGQQPPRPKITVVGDRYANHRATEPMTPQQIAADTTPPARFFGTPTTGSTTSGPTSSGTVTHNNESPLAGLEEEQARGRGRQQQISTSALLDLLSKTPESDLLSKLTERLKTIRDSLSPNGRAGFDLTFAGTGFDTGQTENILEKMEGGAQKRGTTLDEILAEKYRKAVEKAEQERQKAEAANRPWEELVPPEAAEKIKNALSDIKSARKIIDNISQKHPNISERGLQSWRNGLDSAVESIEKFRTNFDEPSLNGVLSGVYGKIAEIDFANRAQNVSDVDLPVSLDVRGRYPGGSNIDALETQVDVLTDNGRVWHEVKDYNLFGLQVWENEGDSGGQEVAPRPNKHARGIAEQAIRQLLIAAYNPQYHVDGRPPEIRIEFLKGVTLEVARALEHLPEVLPALQNLDPEMRPKLTVVGKRYADHRSTTPMTDQEIEADTTEPFNLVEEAKNNKRWKIDRALLEPWSQRGGETSTASPSTTSQTSGTSTTNPASSSTDQETSTDTSTDRGPTNESGESSLRRGQMGARGPVGFGSTASGPRAGSDITQDIRTRADEARSFLEQLPATPELTQRLSELDNITRLADRVDQLAGESRQTNDVRPLMDALRELSQAIQEYAERYSLDRVGHNLDGARDVGSLDPLDPATMNRRIAAVDPQTGLLNPVDLAIMATKIEDLMGPGYADRILAYADRMVPLEPDAARRVLTQIYGPDADQAYRTLEKLLNDPHLTGALDPTLNLILARPGIPLDALASTLVHEITHAMQQSVNETHELLRQRTGSDREAYRRSIPIAVEMEFQGFAAQRRFLQRLMDSQTGSTRPVVPEVHPAILTGDRDVILEYIQLNYAQRWGQESGLTWDEVFSTREMAEALSQLDLEQAADQAVEAAAPDQNRPTVGPITEAVFSELGIDLDQVPSRPDQQDAALPPTTENSTPDQSPAPDHTSPAAREVRRSADLTQQLQQRIQQIADQLRQEADPADPAVSRQLAALESLAGLAEQVNQRVQDVQQSGDLTPLVDGLRDLSRAIGEYAEAYPADRSQDLARLDPLNPAGLMNLPGTVDPDTGRFHVMDRAIMLTKIEDTLGSDFARHAREFMERLVPLDRDAAMKVLEEQYGSEAPLVYRNAIEPLIADEHSRGAYSTKTGLLLAAPNVPLSEVTALLAHESVHALQPPMRRINQLLRGKVVSVQDARQRQARIKLEREFQAYAVQRRFYRELAGQPSAINQVVPEQERGLARANDRDIISHIEQLYFSSPRQTGGLSLDELLYSDGADQAVARLNLDEAADQVLRSVAPDNDQPLVGPVTRLVFDQLGIDLDQLPPPGSTDQTTGPASVNASDGSTSTQDQTRGYVGDPSSLNPGPYNQQPNGPVPSPDGETTQPIRRPRTTPLTQPPPPAPPPMQSVETVPSPTAPVIDIWALNQMWTQTGVRFGELEGRLRQAFQEAQAAEFRPMARLKRAVQALLGRGSRTPDLSSPSFVKKVLEKAGLGVNYVASNTKVAVRNADFRAEHLLQVDLVSPGVQTTNGYVQPFSVTRVHIHLNISNPDLLPDPDRIRVRQAMNEAWQRGRLITDDQMRYALTEINLSPPFPIASNNQTAVPVAPQSVSVPGQSSTYLSQPALSQPTLPQTAPPSEAIRQAQELGPERARRVWEFAEMTPNGALFFDKNDGTYQFAKNLPWVPGFYTVSLHGLPSWVDAGDVRLTAQQLARQIRQMPNWRGHPIFLMSCWTGNDPHGVARELSNALGVPVWAPSNLGWIYETGYFISSAEREVPDPTPDNPNQTKKVPVEPPNGHWLLFYPNEPRVVRVPDLYSVVVRMQQRALGLQSPPRPPLVAPPLNFQLPSNFNPFEIDPRLVEPYKVHTSQNNSNQTAAPDSATDSDGSTNNYIGYVPRNSAPVSVSTSSGPTSPQNNPTSGQQSNTPAVRGRTPQTVQSTDPQPTGLASVTPTLLPEGMNTQPRPVNRPVNDVAQTAWQALTDIGNRDPDNQRVAHLGRPGSFSIRTGRFSSVLLQVTTDSAQNTPLRVERTSDGRLVVSLSYSLSDADIRAVMGALLEALTSDGPRALDRPDFLRNGPMFGRGRPRLSLADVVNVALLRSRLADLAALEAQGDAHKAEADALRTRIDQGLRELGLGLGRRNGVWRYTADSLVRRRAIDRLLTDTDRHMLARLGVPREARMPARWRTRWRAHPSVAVEVATQTVAAGKDLEVAGLDSQPSPLDPNVPAITIDTGQDPDAGVAPGTRTAIPEHARQGESRPSTDRTKTTWWQDLVQNLKGGGTEATAGTTSLYNWQVWVKGRLEAAKEELLQLQRQAANHQGDPKALDSLIDNVEKRINQFETDYTFWTGLTTVIYTGFLSFLTHTIAQRWQYKHIQAARIEQARSDQRENQEHAEQLARTLDTALEDVSRQIEQELRNALQQRQQELQAQAQAQQNQNQQSQPQQAQGQQSQSQPSQPQGAQSQQSPSQQSQAQQGQTQQGQGQQSQAQQNQPQQGQAQAGQTSTPDAGKRPKTRRFTREAVAERIRTQQAMRSDRAVTVTVPWTLRTIGGLIAGFPAFLVQHLTAVALWTINGLPGFVKNAGIVGSFGLLSVSVAAPLSNYVSEVKAARAKRKHDAWVRQRMELEIAAQLDQALQDAIGQAVERLASDPSRFAEEAAELVEEINDVRASLPDLVDAAMGVTAGKNLRQLAAARGLRIGTSLNTDALANDPRYEELIKQQFNAVTLENEFSWKNISPDQGRYDWTKADQAIEFADRHGQQVRGSALIDPDQLPDWITNGNFTPDELIRILEEHTTEVVSHYRGWVNVWEVINGPLQGDGSLRQTVGQNTLGPEYIAKVLEAAHAADPNARLYISESGIEGINPKSDALYDLVKSLLEQGVPIHGISIQSPIALGDLSPSFEENIRRFTDLGLEVTITGLEVRMEMPVTAEKLEQQAAAYRRIISAALENPRVRGVSFSGGTDAHTRVPSGSTQDGAGALFDQNYQPKPAFIAVQQAMADLGQALEARQEAEEKAKQQQDQKRRPFSRLRERWRHRNERPPAELNPDEWSAKVLGPRPSGTMAWWQHGVHMMSAVATPWGLFSGLLGAILTVNNPTLGFTQIIGSLIGSWAVFGTAAHRDGIRSVNLAYKTTMEQFNKRLAVFRTRIEEQFKGGADPAIPAQSQSTPQTSSTSQGNQGTQQGNQGTQNSGQATQNAPQSGQSSNSQSPPARRRSASRAAELQDMNAADPAPSRDPEKSTWKEYGRAILRGAAKGVPFSMILLGVSLTLDHFRNALIALTSNLPPFINFSGMAENVIHQVWLIGGMAAIVGPIYEGIADLWHGKRSQPAQENFQRRVDSFLRRTRGLEPSVWQSQQGNNQPSPPSTRRTRRFQSLLNRLKPGSRRGGNPPSPPTPPPSGSSPTPSSPAPQSPATPNAASPSTPATQQTGTSNTSTSSTPNTGTPSTNTSSSTSPTNQKRVGQASQRRQASSTSPQRGRPSGGPGFWANLGRRATDIIEIGGTLLIQYAALAGTPYAFAWTAVMGISMGVGLVVTAAFDQVFKKAVAALASRIAARTGEAADRQAAKRQMSLGMHLARRMPGPLVAGALTYVAASTLVPMLPAGLAFAAAVGAPIANAVRAVTDWWSDRKQAKWLEQHPDVEGQLLNRLSALGEQAAQVAARIQGKQDAGLNITPAEREAAQRLLTKLSEVEQKLAEVSRAQRRSYRPFQSALQQAFQAVGATWRRVSGTPTDQRINERAHRRAADGGRIRKRYFFASRILQGFGWGSSNFIGATQSVGAGMLVAGAESVTSMFALGAGEVTMENLNRGFGERTRQAYHTVRTGRTALSEALGMGPGQDADSALKRESRLAHMARGWATPLITVPVVGIAASLFGVLPAFAAGLGVMTLYSVVRTEVDWRYIPKEEAGVQQRRAYDRLKAASETDVVIESVAELADKVTNELTQQDNEYTSYVEQKRTEQAEWEQRRRLRLNRRLPGYFSDAVGETPLRQNHNVTAEATSGAIQDFEVPATTDSTTQNQTRLSESRTAVLARQALPEVLARQYGQTPTRELLRPGPNRGRSGSNQGRSEPNRGVWFKLKAPDGRVHDSFHVRVDPNLPPGTAARVRVSQGLVGRSVIIEIAPPPNTRDNQAQITAIIEAAVAQHRAHLDRALGGRRSAQADVLNPSYRNRRFAHRLLGLDFSPTDIGRLARIQSLGEPLADQSLTPTQRQRRLNALTRELTAADLLNNPVKWRYARAYLSDKVARFIEQQVLSQQNPPTGSPSNQGPSGGGSRPTLRQRLASLRRWIVPSQVRNAVSFMSSPARGTLAAGQTTTGGQTTTSTPTASPTTQAQTGQSTTGQPTTTQSTTSQQSSRFTQAFNRLRSRVTGGQSGQRAQQRQAQASGQSQPPRFRAIRGRLGIGRVMMATAAFAMAVTAALGPSTPHSSVNSPQPTQTVRVQVTSTPTTQTPTATPTQRVTPGSESTVETTPSSVSVSPSGNSTPDGDRRGTTTESTNEQDLNQDLNPDEGLPPREQQRREDSRRKHGSRRNRRNRNRRYGGNLNRSSTSRKPSSDPNATPDPNATLDPNATPDSTPGTTSQTTPDSNMGSTTQQTSTSNSTPDPDTSSRPDQKSGQEQNTTTNQASNTPAPSQDASANQAPTRSKRSRWRSPAAWKEALEQRRRRQAEPQLGAPSYRANFRRRFVPGIFLVVSTAVTALATSNPAIALGWAAAQTAGTFADLITTTVTDWWSKRREARQRQRAAEARLRGDSSVSENVPKWVDMARRAGPKIVAGGITITVGLQLLPNPWLAVLGGAGQILGGLARGYMDGWFKKRKKAWQANQPSTRRPDEFRGRDVADVVERMLELAARAEARRDSGDLTPEERKQLETAYAHMDQLAQDLRAMIDQRRETFHPIREIADSFSQAVGRRLQALREGRVFGRRLWGDDTVAARAEQSQKQKEAAMLPRRFIYIRRAVQGIASSTAQFTAWLLWGSPSNVVRGSSSMLGNLGLAVGEDAHGRLSARAGQPEWEALWSVQHVLNQLAHGLGREAPDYLPEDPPHRFAHNVRASGPASGAALTLGVGALLTGNPWLTPAALASVLQGRSRAPRDWDFELEEMRREQELTDRIVRQEAETKRAEPITDLARDLNTRMEQLRRELDATLQERRQQQRDAEARRRLRVSRGLAGRLSDARHQTPLRPARPVTHSVSESDAHTFTVPKIPRQHGSGQIRNPNRTIPRILESTLDRQYPGLVVRPDPDAPRFLIRTEPGSNQFTDVFTVQVDPNLSSETAAQVTVTVNEDGQREVTIHLSPQLGRLDHQPVLEAVIARHRATLDQRNAGQRVGRDVLTDQQSRGRRFLQWLFGVTFSPRDIGLLAQIQSLAESLTPDGRKGHDPEWVRRRQQRVAVALDHADLLFNDTKLRRARAYWTDEVGTVVDEVVRLARSHPDEYGITPPPARHRVLHQRIADITDRVLPDRLRRAISLSPTTRPRVTPPITPGQSPHVNPDQRRPSRPRVPWGSRYIRDDVELFSYFLLTSKTELEPADLVRPEPPKPRTYVVQRGDTLSSIAEKLLGDANRWPEIFELNRGRTQTTGWTFTDPDQIDIGWELQIPPKEEPEKEQDRTPGKLPELKKPDQFGLTGPVVGLFIIESTVDRGMRTLTWMKGTGWVPGGGIPDTVTAIPADRGTAEQAAASLGISLPSESELHQMMGG